IIEILYGLPSLLVVILLLVVLGPSLLTIIIALSVHGWVGMTRIVRGQVLQLKNEEFVLASQSFGATTWRIIRKNLLPNTMGPIIVQMTLTVPTAIFAEAFLSFIGLGIQSPYASWGVMADDALGAIFFPVIGGHCFSRRFLSRSRCLHLMCSVMGYRMRSIRNCGSRWNHWKTCLI